MIRDALYWERKPDPMQAVSPLFDADNKRGICSVRLNKGGG